MQKYTSTSIFKVVEIYLSKLSIPAVLEYFLVRGAEKYNLVDFPIYLNNSALSLLIYPNLTRLLTFTVLTTVPSLSLTIIIKQYTNHEKILKLFRTVNIIITKPKTIRTYHRYGDNSLRRLFLSTNSQRKLTL